MAKQTRLLMGMPITIEIAENLFNEEIFAEIFAYFDYVDKKFSTYKEDSEISLINQGRLQGKDYSQDMQEVWRLCEQTKTETKGYFNIKTPAGPYDPSGLVKGWAIYKASQILKNKGFNNFYIEAGGDIQAYGRNSAGEVWRVGIRNPFKEEEIIKIVALADMGIATSGTYLRGQHIYNPFQQKEPIREIVSLTVIGLNVYEADRFATAAFAMGKEGINFIENLSGLEGYMIDEKGVATMTSGFKKYVI